MTVHIVFNHDSLNAAADAPSDEDLLVTLIEAYRFLRDAVTRSDWEQLKIILLRHPWELKLPGGTKFQQALGTLRRRNRDLAAFFQQIISKASTPDEEESIPNPNASYTALRYAWKKQGISWSTDQPGWRISPLPFSFQGVDGSREDASVPNVFRAALQTNDREALMRAGVRVVPLYEDPGHHDPNRPNLYDRRKSHIPVHAEELLRHAIPEENGTTFWARCECEFYHRFQGTRQGDWMKVHWNGTTNEEATGNRKRSEPTSESDIPNDIRRQLQKNRPADRCGCREKKRA